MRLPPVAPGPLLAAGPAEEPEPPPRLGRLWLELVPELEEDEEDDPPDEPDDPEDPEEPDEPLDPRPPLPPELPPPPLFLPPPRLPRRRGAMMAADRSATTSPVIRIVWFKSAKRTGTVRIWVAAGPVVAGPVILSRLR
ncbi:MAG: hypothetical protein WD696_23415 [Bryobacteraceae bacterium]